MTEPQEPEAQQLPAEPAQQTAPEIPPEIAQQEFAYSDHRLYSNALYAQPVWVVDAVFGTGVLDQNAKYKPADVQTAIDQMMLQEDKQFAEVTQ